MELFLNNKYNYVSPRGGTVFRKDVQKLQSIDAILQIRAFKYMYIKIWQ